MLPLTIAIVVMLGITAWPAALESPTGGADHIAATALFWSMSAGFVSGVGFRPRIAVVRLLLSGSACLAGLALAVWRVVAPLV
jgi:predicted membrane protein